jgi:TetR/AcrR family transcriptional regulator
VKKRAPKRAAHERRRLILEGAQSVFAASSYARAGTSEVAKAAGVSAPALYRYFPSKKDLYLSTLAAASPRLLEIWKRAAAETADPLEMFWTIGRGYYEHVRSRSPITRIWFQALAEAGDPEVRGALRENFIAGVDFLEENLKKGKIQGVVRRDLDTRAAAWHFMAIGLTFDLIHLLHLDEELNRRRVENWGRLYLASIREKPHGAAKHKPEAAARRAVPVRKPHR